MNSPPICRFHSKTTQKFIQLPEIYDELLKKVSNKFLDEELDDILLIPDSTTDFIEGSNYFGLYFKATFTQSKIKWNQQIPYESVEVMSSQVPEKTYDSTGSDSDEGTDDDLGALMEEALFE